MLLAYGISKTSITRLKKGDFNLSKTKGEILYKKKIFFKEEATGSLLSSIDSIAKDESVIKHKPRFAIVTDYKTLVAKDLKLGKNLDIPIKDLPKYYGFFSPLAGSEVYHSANDNEADRNAAYKMADLYDLLIHENPDIYNSKETVHNLNVFLSRLLFCFFAEDTEIFAEESIFTNTLAQHTLEIGSDTHTFLNRLFERLNTENSKEFPEHFAKFDYVNGGLFKDSIDSPVFSSKARKILIKLGELNWKNINPDIFGSMIQAVVKPEYRSDLGMHYTSVENIKKLIRPLFLDELKDLFEKYQNNAPQLRKLIQRIAQIKFFDPACGSGNFLIITYKEIRQLEIKIIQQIIALEKIGLFTDAFTTSVSLNQFYGIELDDFAHEMAILSLWLAEHQMNRVFDEMLEGFGASKPILPLKEAGKIVQGNAARIEWEDVCFISKDDEIYIAGNPPYYGSRKQNQGQKDDLEFVFKTNFNSLDYVAIWFYKGAKYITSNNAQCAFVSTNSVSQGLLVSLIWNRVLTDSIEIGFAHQSFKWTNNAKGNAGVTVVIIGLRNISTKTKYLYKDGLQKEVKNISAYLENSTNLIVSKAEKSISGFPEINFGNMPAEGGKLIFTDKEKQDFVSKEPRSEKWFRELVSSREFINGIKRWCLWLVGISEREINEMTVLRKLIEEIREIRLNSSRPKLANIPHLFAQITQTPNSNCIIVPRITSANRIYLPIGIIDSNESIVTDSLYTISTSEPYLFGILSSRLHLVWVKATGGKMKTDYRYAKDLCYNTFPFPNITSKQQENLNLYVFAILDERARYSEKTMAWLYNPATMPKGLKQAHEELDKAIEQCYRLQPFTSDTERLEYLFKLYEEMTKKDTLFAKQKKTRKIK